MSSSKEIAKAISTLSEKTLKDSIKAYDSKFDGEGKEKLHSTYTETVTKVGLEGFIEKMKEKELTASLKAMGLDAKGDAKENGKALLDSLKEANALLSKADLDLLKDFSTLLGLDSGNKEEMTKNIADEVMLTGMEKFLNGLTLATLKNYATELKITTTGNKKQLVEKLMVHIFELHPLEDNTKTKSPKKDSPKKEKKETKEKKEKETKTKTDSKKRGRSKSPAKEDKEDEKTTVTSKSKKGKTRSASASPSKPKSSRSSSRSKSPATTKSKTKKEEPKKREKHVAPALSTIKKGGYDNKIDLHDNFNLTDLQEYCKQNGLKSSTRQKKDLIKEIIYFIENGSAMPPKAKRGAKRTKKTETKGSPATKKQKKTTEKTEEKEKEKSEEKSEEKTETAKSTEKKGKGKKQRKRNQ